MRTRVVNLLRESYHVYIGRGGRGQDGTFGNPIPLHSEDEREEVVRSYRTYFRDRIARDPDFRRKVEQLRGKRLGCFCAPRPCHGDMIVEFLEGRTVQG